MNNYIIHDKSLKRALFISFFSILYFLNKLQSQQVINKILLVEI